ncbi:hypothetical protein AVEN_74407-1 [Araneus ventricosus]|uniref:Secreted protein n=1 Tax=Araneus ventricosus TaxID=182803 RepID=A0A4Y2J8Y3_ARAVE|nr:hypothetical protein AVEN_74407-1 [Araneus ventricosus]
MLSLIFLCKIASGHVTAPHINRDPHKHNDVTPPSLGIRINLNGPTPRTNNSDTRCDYPSARGTGDRWEITRRPLHYCIPPIRPCLLIRQFLIPIFELTP